MKNRIITIAIILLCAIFAFSCFMIIRDKVIRSKEISDFKDIAEIVNDTTVADTTDSIDSSIVDDTIETEKAPVFKRNLAPVFQMNSDCIGWICIDGTTVDYPVMYTPNEAQKYLRKNFEGKYSISGIPFMQENCSLDCDNIIIYGHNMENGTMFSDITKYVDREYVNQFPDVEFETAKGLEVYSVYAVAQVKSTDPWYSFIFASDAEDFDLKISDIKTSALYCTDDTPLYGEQILTLSTCYGSNSNDRLIVICVKK